MGSISRPAAVALTLLVCAGIGLANGLIVTVLKVNGFIATLGVGLGILLWRRITNEHVWATTVPMDVLVVLLILINGCTGFYQAYVAHFPVFVTVGPWLRSLVVFRPDVVLMETVPLFLQIHVVSAFTLFALIPFSRLVHIFSVPVTYALRPFQIYRRRYAGL